MPSTALQLMSTIAPSEFATLVVAGRLRSAEVAHALTSVPHAQASEAMAALPVLHQAQLTREEIGGSTEAALLPLMLPEAATASVMVDAAVFSEMNELDRWMDYFIHGKGLDEIEDAKDRRVLMIVDASGNERKMVVRVHPERALVYLSTIIRSTDEDWRDAMLEALGHEFLAFVMRAAQDDVASIDDDLSREIAEITPKSYWYAAMDMTERLTLEEIEYDLVDKHAYAMRKAFVMPEGIEETEAKADDLVAGLDLG
ncbi:MAG: hypothetical protein ABIA47_00675 [bacterium]